jgi:hypothetical protein
VRPLVHNEACELRAIVHDDLSRPPRLTEPFEQKPPYVALGTSTEPLRTNAISTASTGGNGVFWCSDRAPATNTKRFPASERVPGIFLCVSSYVYPRLRRVFGCRSIRSTKTLTNSFCSSMHPF